MPTGDHYLTHPKRSQIIALKTTGLTLRQIAEQLGLDVGTISRGCPVIAGSEASDSASLREGRRASAGKPPRCPGR